MLPKFIEIVGPPGIGKTSIYNALCKSWHPAYNWIHQDALLSPAPSFSEFNKWVDYHCRKLMGRKLAKTIPVEFGLHFIQNHPELADFCWQHLTITYSQEIDKRYRAAYFLFTDFCRYQAVLERNNKQSCIINEGLLQKSFLIDYDPQNLTNLLNNYFALLPLPYAIIHINTENKHTILERLKNREKVIATHLEKDNGALLQDIERWQQLLSRMVGLLQKKGVKVFDVDGAKPIRENVILIKEQLDMHGLS